MLKEEKEGKRKNLEMGASQDRVASLNLHHSCNSTANSVPLPVRHAHWRSGLRCTLSSSAEHHSAGNDFDCRSFV